MNQDSFKNLFKGIVIILLVIIALLIVPVLCSSCHTQKKCESSATASATAATVASQDLAAVELQRLDRTFTITLDDLELYFNDDIPLEDLALLQGDDSVSLDPAPLKTRDARRAPLRLKARSAVISSAATAQSSSTVVAHQQDSTIRQEAAQSRTVESSEHTAVANPVPPWVYALAAGMAILMIGVVWYLKK